MESPSPSPHLHDEMTDQSDDDQSSYQSNDRSSSPSNDQSTDPSISEDHFLAAAALLSASTAVVHSRTQSNDLSVGQTNNHPTDDQIEQSDNQSNERSANQSSYKQPEQFDFSHHVGGFLDEYEPSILALAQLMNGGRNRSINHSNKQSKSRSVSSSEADNDTDVDEPVRKSKKKPSKRRKENSSSIKHSKKKSRKRRRDITESDSESSSDSEAEYRYRQRDKSSKQSDDESSESSSSSSSSSSDSDVSPVKPARRVKQPSKHSTYGAIKSPTKPINGQCVHNWVDENGESQRCEGARINQSGRGSEHMMMHSNTTARFQCSLCLGRASHRGAVRIHIRACHSRQDAERAIKGLPLGTVIDCLTGETLPPISPLIKPSDPPIKQSKNEKKKKNKYKRRKSSSDEESDEKPKKKRTSGFEKSVKPEQTVTQSNQPKHNEPKDKFNKQQNKSPVFQSTPSPDPEPSTSPIVQPIKPASRSRSDSTGKIDIARLSSPPDVEPSNQSLNQSAYQSMEPLAPEDSRCFFAFVVDGQQQKCEFDPHDSKGRLTHHRATHQSPSQSPKKFACSHCGWQSMRAKLVATHIQECHSELDLMLKTFDKPVGRVVRIGDDVQDDTNGNTVTSANDSFINQPINHSIHEPDQVTPLSPSLNGRSLIRCDFKWTDARGVIEHCEYTCLADHSSIKNNQQMALHQLSHIATDCTYECSHCKAQSNSYDEMQDHLEQCHALLEEKAAIEGRPLGGINVLKNDQPINQPVNKLYYPVRVSPIQLAKEAAMSAQTPHQCPYHFTDTKGQRRRCEFSFTMPHASNRSQHEAIHHTTNRRFGCSHCHAQAGSVHAVFRHITLCHAALDSELLSAGLTAGVPYAVDPNDTKGAAMIEREALSLKGIKQPVKQNDQSTKPRSANRRSKNQQSDDEVLDDDVLMNAQSINHSESSDVDIEDVALSHQSRLSTQSLRATQATTRTRCAFRFIVGDEVLQCEYAAPARNHHNWATHSAMHLSVNRSYECGWCGAQSNTASNIRKHILKGHVNLLEKYDTTPDPFIVRVTESESHNAKARQDPLNAVYFANSYTAGLPNEEPESPKEQNMPIQRTRSTETKLLNGAHDVEMDVEKAASQPTRASSRLQRLEQQQQLLREEQLLREQQEQQLQQELQEQQEYERLAQEEEHLSSDDTDMDVTDEFPAIYTETIKGEVRARDAEGYRICMLPFTDPFGHSNFCESRLSSSEVRRQRHHALHAASGKPYMCSHCHCQSDTRGAIQKHIRYGHSRLDAKLRKKGLETGHVMELSDSEITSSTQAAPKQRSVSSSPVLSTSTLTVRTRRSVQPEEPEEPSGEDTEDEMNDNFPPIYTAPPGSPRDAEGYRICLAEFTDCLGEKNFCEARLSSSEVRRQRHYALHAATGKPYMCSHCHSQSEFRGAMQNHIRYSHSRLDAKLRKMGMEPGHIIDLDRTTTAPVQAQVAPSRLTPSFPVLVPNPNATMRTRQSAHAVHDQSNHHSKNLLSTASMANSRSSSHTASLESFDSESILSAATLDSEQIERIRRQYRIDFRIASHYIEGGHLVDDGSVEWRSLSNASRGLLLALKDQHQSTNSDQTIKQANKRTARQSNNSFNVQSSSPSFSPFFNVQSTLSSILPNGNSSTDHDPVECAKSLQSAKSRIQALEQELDRHRQLASQLSNTLADLVDEE